MITVVRLVATPLHRKIAIWKLNNIMINWLANPRLSMLLDKWRFDTSLDWEVLENEFNSVSSKTMPYATLQALGFHYSLLDYLEKRAVWFINITDKPKLAIKPEDNNQPITDSEDEKVKKRLECATKKKVQRNTLCASI